MEQELLVAPSGRNPRKGPAVLGGVFLITLLALAYGFWLGFGRDQVSQSPIPARDAVERLLSAREGKEFAKSLDDVTLKTDLREAIHELRKEAAGSQSPREDDGMRRALAAIALHRLGQGVLDLGFDGDVSAQSAFLAVHVRCGVLPSSLLGPILAEEPGAARAVALQALAVDEVGHLTPTERWALKERLERLAAHTTDPRYATWCEAIGRRYELEKMPPRVPAR